EPWYGPDVTVPLRLERLAALLLASLVVSVMVDVFPVFHLIVAVPTAPFELGPYVVKNIWQFVGGLLLDVKVRWPLVAPPPEHPHKVPTSDSADLTVEPCTGNPGLKAPVPLSSKHEFFGGVTFPILIAGVAADGVPTPVAFCAATLKRYVLPFVSEE